MEAIVLDNGWWAEVKQLVELKVRPNLVAEAIAKVKELG
jgi:hypothetical protein